MPQSIALTLYKAYQTKRKSAPTLPKETVYKHLLWSQLDGRMVLDSDIDRMAREADSLLDVTVMVVQQLKPQFKDPALSEALRRELKTYFSLNMPDAL